MLSETTLPIGTPTLEAGEKRWLLWSIIFLGLILLLYMPVLRGLVSQWWNDSDYGHGFLVPMFSAYVLWRGRQRWTRCKLAPSNFGLLAMVGAVLLLFIGSLGAELFTSRFSLLILLAGMVLFLAGWNLLRDVSFPLAFLVLMIPIPAIVYNQITFPLQLLASRVGAFWLQMVRVPVLREGNVLVLPNYTLEVVEACSGIRSLVSLITLAVAYGYLAEGRRWARYLLAVLMIPVAIVSNAMRIVGTGVVTYHFGPAVSEGFFHEFSGWLVFLTALVLMFGCHAILKHLGRPPEHMRHV